MEYRKLTRISAVFLIIPGLLAFLFPAPIWEALAGGVNLQSSDSGLSLELLRVIGAFFLGLGIPLWLFLAEIESPVEQQRTVHLQLFVALALLLSFVHMAITTSMSPGVGGCLIWAAIPLALISRVILFPKSDA